MSVCLWGSLLISPPSESEVDQDLVSLKSLNLDLNLNLNLSLSLNQAVLQQAQTATLGALELTKTLILLL